MNRRERRASRAFVRTTSHVWHPIVRVDVDPVRFLQHAARTGDLRSCWHNNIYAIQVFARQTADGEALQLTINRHDNEEIEGWSDLQRIKNEVVGAHRVAIEIYPPESEVMDQANMRHLFVLPEGVEAPFTLRGGRWT